MWYLETAIPFTFLTHISSSSSYKVIGDCVIVSISNNVFHTQEFFNLHVLPFFPILLPILFASEGVRPLNVPDNVDTSSSKTTPRSAVQFDEASMIWKSIKSFVYHFD